MKRLVFKRASAGGDVNDGSTKVIGLEMWPDSGRRLGWLVGSAQEILKNKRYSIFSEMTLLVASVLVFRGLWLLLYTIEWLNRPAGLWASLALGMIAAIVALAVVNRATSK